MSDLKREDKPFLEQYRDDPEFARRADEKIKTIFSSPKWLAVIDSLQRHFRETNEELKSRGFTFEYTSFDALWRIGYMLGIDPRPFTAGELIDRLIAWDDAERHKARLLAEALLRAREAALPQKQREIMTLLKGRSLTGKELAAELDCNEQALNRDHLRPLLLANLIQKSRRVGGYYRSDDPPRD